jgi:hypothetical protein
VHIVLLQLWLAQMQILSNLAGSHAKLFSLDNLQNGAGAGTFKPLSPIMKPAPKRLRTLLITKPVLAILQGLLPARSNLNDLVRLRAAIITSCISGARKI